MDHHRSTVGVVGFRFLPAFLLALVFLFAGPVALAQLPSIGTVENVVGALMVKRADGRTDQLKGKGALPLYEGDECKTSQGSKAFIKLSDGTQVAMNTETTFLVQTRRERDKGLTRIFKLFVGEMWFKTSEPVPLEVETPIATAAIKGTEFNLQVQPDGKSILTVVEGLVEFGTPFGTCPIRSSTISFGERGKKCTKPAPFDAPSATTWIADVVK